MPAALALRARRPEGRSRELADARVEPGFSSGAPLTTIIKKARQKEAGFFNDGGEGGITARLRRLPFGLADRQVGLVSSLTLGSNRGSYPGSPSPRSLKKPAKKRRAFLMMAEREGFEPSVRDKPHTHFPGEPVRPLRHLS